MYRSVFEYIEESEEGGIQRYKGVIGQLRAVLPGGKAPLQVTLGLALTITMTLTLTLDLTITITLTPKPNHNPYP